MLSLNFFKSMLDRYERNNKVGIADSTFRGAATRALEKQKLADEIEALKIDPSWRPDEVLRYVAKLVRNS